MASLPAESRITPFQYAAPIPTARLTLRLFTLDDVEDSLAYQSREDVVRYMLFDALSREETLERTTIRLGTRSLENDGDFLVLAVELPAAADAPARVIGDVNLQLKSAASAQATIGWAMHPDYQGRGYAAEAAAALLDLGFGTVGLHRVFAELDPRNAASAALCVRLGMRHEAHLVEELYFKGGWGDTDVYAILDREWSARQGSPRG
jgi:RimJ/RimL family protein N-acetyltransferase